jgi:hypothetical protein
VDDPVFLLYETHSPLQAIVRKFTAQRPDVDGDELIARIPLEGAGAVAGEITIGVIRECLRRPLLVTSYVFVVLLPLGSVAVTATVLVPDGIGVVPLNTFVADTDAGLPAIVTVAASFTVPSNRSAPAGCWLTS